MTALHSFDTLQTRYIFDVFRIIYIYGASVMHAAAAVPTFHYSSSYPLLSNVAYTTDHPSLSEEPWRGRLRPPPVLLVLSNVAITTDHPSLHEKTWRGSLHIYISTVTATRRRRYLILNVVCVWCLRHRPSRAPLGKLFEVVFPCGVVVLRPVERGPHRLSHKQPHRLEQANKKTTKNKK